MVINCEREDKLSETSLSRNRTVNSGTFLCHFFCHFDSWIRSRLVKASSQYLHSGLHDVNSISLALAAFVPWSQCVTSCEGKCTAGSREFMVREEARRVR